MPQKTTKNLRKKTTVINLNWLHVVVRLFGVTKVQEEDVEEEEAEEMWSGGLQKRRNVKFFFIDQNEKNYVRIQDGRRFPVCQDPGITKAVTVFVTQITITVVSLATNLLFQNWYLLGV